MAAQSEKKEMAVKTHKKLPVHIVEDHNEALNFIYSAIGSRYLPLYNNCLIHFDSHPDLLVPKDMPADTVYNKLELFNHLSIENWILPTCYSAQFNSIYWVKPAWSNQIPLGNYKVHVGAVNNKIRVNSNLYYFLSDGLYVGKEQLENRKEFDLNVVDMTDPDLVEELTSFLKTKGFYVLDIDLDFFSTNNPFSKLFRKGHLYDKLKNLYAFSLPQNLVVDTEDEDDKSQEELRDKVTSDRNRQLGELDTIFKHLEARGSLEEIAKDLSVVKKSSVRDVIRCVKEYYSMDNVDWYLLHNAGMTCDATELPCHVSSENELDILFRRFEDFIRSIKVRPAIITIARSTEDDYCPGDQVAFIQDSVVTALERTFGELSINRSYERKR